MIDGPRQKLLLFPGIFGEETSFSDLRDALSSRFETEVVPYPGLAAPSSLLLDIGATAASVAARLRPVPSDERIVIVGYSYGANLAFELAGRLQVAGGRLALLVLLDPALPTTDFDVHRRGPAVDILGAPLPRPGFVYRSRFPRSALAAFSRLAPARTRERFQRRTLWTLRAYARRAWTPRPVDCPVLHVMTEQFAPAVAQGWRSLCLDIRQVTVGSRHVDLLKGAALSAVVQVVSAALCRTASENGLAPDGLRGRGHPDHVTPIRVDDVSLFEPTGLPPAHP